MSKTLEQRIYDGDQARLVLENPAFSSAFADLKAEITAQWEASPARDRDGREELFKLLKLAAKLELILKSSLDGGTLAKHELKQKQNWTDRAKQAVGL